MSSSTRLACPFSPPLLASGTNQSLTNSLANLAPRVALAWDVRGNGKTIVRAGSGIFYDQLFMYVTRRFITLGPDALTEAITIPYGTPGFPVFQDYAPLVSFKHRGAVMQQARFVIDEILAKGNHYEHRLMNYNNDPQTTFADVQKFFSILEERIKDRLATQSHR